MDINQNLRVSTMTIISNIGSNIILDGLFKNLETDDNIKYIEYGKLNKGVNTKKQRKPRKNVEKKYFYNQVTLHVELDKIINLKIFNNGKLQMTGVKNKTQADSVIDILISKLSSIDNKSDILDNFDLKKKDFKIVLINSDFNIRFKINRNILHRIVTSNGYYSSYEPSIYPGVNIKYYYNHLYNDGICRCHGKCSGKGNGDGESDCKKITVAVFNSGNIIITGAQSNNQLNTAYEFINNLLKEKREELELNKKEID